MAEVQQAIEAAMDSFLADAAVAPSAAVGDDAGAPPEPDRPAVAAPPKSDPAAYTRYFVQSAIARYDAEGLDATLAHYNSPDSVDGQWYLFVVDRNAEVVGHYEEDSRGLSLLGFAGTDANGYKFGPEMLSATTEGKWVRYVYRNPAGGRMDADSTGGFELKNAWVVHHDGLLFGSGWHINIDEFITTLVDEVAESLRTAGLDATVAHYNDPQNLTVGFRGAIDYYNTTATADGTWVGFYAEPDGTVLFHNDPAAIGSNIADRLGPAVLDAPTEAAWITEADNPFGQGPHSMRIRAVNQDGIIFGAGHRSENPAPDPRPVVRVLYAVPSDREFRSDYSQAIRRAVEHVRFWYQRQLDGPTFSLSFPVPEKCLMSQPHDFYARHSWQRVLDGVQHCAPVQAYTSEVVWIVYTDVDLACAPDGSEGEWGDGYAQLGRGGPGLTILPRSDLEGLTERDYVHCGEGTEDRSPVFLGRWIGGLAHELGHGFGLPHPPGCDEELPTCDVPALMQNGYEPYPDTYLRDDDKAALRASPFITRHDPLLQPPAIPCPSATDDGTKSTIRGTLVGPDGRPLGDIGIFASSGDIDTGGVAVTCHDGTFTILVSDGTFSLDVYAAVDGSCAGYFDGESVTSNYSEAVKIVVEGEDIEGISIRLPALPQDIPSGEC